MRKPPYLKAGDKVGIIAIANKCSTEELSSFLNLIDKWQLTPILGKTIDADYHQFGGDDALRIADLQQMSNDDSIKAIFIARGGYGTVRIIDHINFTLLLRKPKWIVGYSDVTVLHSFLQEKMAVSSIHSFVAKETEDRTAGAIDNLKKALFGEDLIYKFAANKLNKTGNLKGKIVGGNLSILCNIHGTKAGWNPSGKILFIEDVGEKLYKIDRMMMQLKRAGKLTGIKGLVVGAFTKMEDNEIPFGKTVPEIVLDAIGEEKYPVIFDFPAGHIAGNQAIRLGQNIELKTENNEVTSIQLA